MARDFNKVILTGRLTRDPEARTTTSGKNLTEFSLAVGEGDDRTSFFDVTAWGKTAELVAKYLNKGSRVLVEGNLRQETWEKDGQKRSKVVVVAFGVTFLDTKSDRQERDNVPDAEVLDGPIELTLADIPF